MIGATEMVSTKNDVVAYINNISTQELQCLCDYINSYQEEKEAEAEFFRQMKIAEDSILSEGTVSEAELRASLGI